MIPLCTYHTRLGNNLVEFFYHDDTVDGTSVLQVVVDNTSKCVVYEFADYDMVFFHWKKIVFGITIFWPMGDTWQFIGGLVPIILMKSSSKDDCFPCSSIFLEGFNEILEGFDELLNVFDELSHVLLLLLLKLDILKLNCVGKWQRKKQN